MDAVKRKDAGKWRDEFRLPPRGIGHLEPGMIDPGSNDMLAFHIAKSAYQVRPDIWNLAWLGKETGLPKGELEKRIRSLYDRRILMLAAVPAVQVYGYGLYYWFRKFRPGTLGGVKLLAAQAAQKNGAIWEGLETTGAFDLVQGACTPTLDQLFWNILLPTAAHEHFEWTRICPIARALRAEHMNLWDAPAGKDREYEWGADEPAALLKAQQQIDEADVRLLLGLNRKRAPQDYFDFRALAEASGLDARTLETGVERLLLETRQLVPIVYLNWQMLGLTQTIFAVRLRQSVTIDRRSQLADELTAIAEFHTIWQFADAHYDLGLMACTQTANIAALRRRIEEIAEVDLVDEGQAHRQYRCWGCRLDDASGMWEQCVAPGAAVAEARA